jgi:hypothetical protein
MLRACVLVACLVWAGAAWAQQRTAPRPDPQAARVTAAREHIARCTDAGGKLAEAQANDISLSFASVLPFAGDILARHRLRASILGGGRQLRVELRLPGVRAVEVPEGNPETIYRTDIDGGAVLQDRRSRIRELWRVDEATVQAAELAYDIRYPDPEDPAAVARLEPSGESAVPEGYRVVRLYTDLYTGFAALVLEAPASRGRPAHRIYAIAGTHVFQNTDLRTWASGLTFGRAQIVSTAALAMVADAAAYAQDMAGGGEVFVTGQSQGGLTSQGFGYLLQTALAEAGARHHLVHVVSWGGVGALEALANLVVVYRRGESRGFPKMFEMHWAAADPGYKQATQAWTLMAASWDKVTPGDEAGHVRAMAARMRVVGYFFEIDLFARAGTFIGTTFAFPTALILPDACDALVAELVAGISAGDFGVRLESHFLQGYRRAVQRGAIALSRPAQPAKWQWVTDVMPFFDSAGRTWLENLYLDGPASRAPHWQQCRAAGLWLTEENNFCRAEHWPGCGYSKAQDRWCMISGDAAGAGAVLR